MFGIALIHGIGLGLEYDEVAEGTIWLLDLLIFRIIYFPKGYLDAA